MDDEDGRCLLDVICDPQALNDFLHGSDKGQLALASEGINSQVPSSTSCVDISFLEDDILGSPGSSGIQQNAEEPCDILQQSLQEANITQQTLQEEADLAASVLQIQPYSHPHPASQPAEGNPQLLGTIGTDFSGLSQQQQTAIITQQPLLQQPVNTQFVNKTISVQRLIQQVGLNSVAIQPIASIQTNGSPRACGIGQIQMVDQHGGQATVMPVGHHHQQGLFAKPGLTSQMSALPSESYLSASPSECQVTLSSSISSQFQKTVTSANLNGNSLFANANLTQSTQQVVARPTISNQVVHTPVLTQIIQRTPTPIQPKHRVNIQPKLVQISPKPSFNPNSSALQTALKIQTETTLQQQKTQQNLTFVAGASGQNVLLSTQGPAVAQTIAANLIKQQPQQVQSNVGKPVSVQVVNQGSSIVIQPQSVPQAVIPGQSQFILPGQLANAAAGSIPQQLPAIQPGTVLTGQSAATPNLPGQPAANHVMGCQASSSQLVSSQSLSAQILTAQHVAGQLITGQANFGQVFAASNTQLTVGQGTAHILSGPLQLRPSQLAPSTLFQMPTQLGAGFSSQSHPSGQRMVVQPGPTVVQGVSLPNQITVLNNTGPLGPSMNVQQVSTNAPKSNIVKSQTSTDAEITSALGLQQTDASPQCHRRTQAQSQTQLVEIQQSTPLSAAVSQPNTTLAENHDKSINQQGMGSALNADQLLLFQQKEQKQQLLYQQALKLQQEKGLSLTSSNGLATSLTANSVPTSVIVSSGIGSAVQTSSILMPASTVLMEPKNQTVLPQSQPSHFLPALASQATPSMISNLTDLNVALSKGSIQIQMVGKGIARIMSAGNLQSALFEEPVGNLKQSAATTLNRGDLLLEKFCKDQSSVIQPDCNTPFNSFEDTVFRLLPYHVCKGTLPSNVDFNKVDEEFEVVSAQLLKRTQVMLNKYRLLLFEESRRTKPSAEMVMIDRMFIQEEKVAFQEAKQLARDSPDAYISSIFKPRITSTLPTASCPLAAPNEQVQSSTQVTDSKLVIKQARSSPSVTWATASPVGDVEMEALPSRPKPLKTYVASSRGGLKLKIKQESGYSKVVHNTALDQLSPPPIPRSSGTKGPSTVTVIPLRQSNGDLNRKVPPLAEKRLLEHLDIRDALEQRDYLTNLGTCERNCPVSCTPSLVPDQSKTSLLQINSELNRSIEYEINQKAALGSGRMDGVARPLNSHDMTADNGFQSVMQVKTEELAGGKTDDSTSNLMKELAEVEDAFRQGLMKVGSADDLHWELPLPQPKRRKSDSVDNASFSSDSPQDSTLNEHLQSAINSILDLQRLQASEEEQSVTGPPISAELDIPQFSPMASSGDFMEPDHDSGLVEVATSTLEEAVNSILARQVFSASSEALLETHGIVDIVNSG
ncbi:BRD4-interacting chromatin-remodeling complex-associated protein-like isoform X1 [Carcharodon carcharias]|uniref:BRD4-interacting chromatin-remodeling complex-associated protein-like isoform X1 n=1 Tax=Carcharodon carcharias TaxID=13397 RepID=UPI001B7E7A1A|nr:BRD4-interacting chromatin-remodeling complex-associated protein-like isoform X1 [Carcharodon carcharias]